MEGIPSLIKSLITPPRCVLFSLDDGVNLSRINWLEGNEAFNFISDINITSVLCPVFSCNTQTYSLKVYVGMCKY